MYDATDAYILAMHIAEVQEPLRRVSRLAKLVGRADLAAQVGEFSKYLDEQASLLQMAADSSKGEDDE